MCAVLVLFLSLFWFHINSKVYCIYVTLVGAGDRVFGTLWPVLVAHFYISRLETTVLTGELSLET